MTYVNKLNVIIFHIEGRGVEYWNIVLSLANFNILTP